jgi:putative PIN family toxin of toxin-antitoxin system
MLTTIVLDTNILVAALQNQGIVARTILRLCLNGEIQALIGAALFAEYEDVLNRDSLFENSKLNKQERDQVIDGFLSVCKWSEVFYAWRPNLPDEADNHLIELAIAGQASFIVTRNLKDLTKGELIFNQLQIVGPEHFLELIQNLKEST